MLNRLMLLPAVFAAALFTACGDDSSSGSNNTEQAGCSVSENKDGSYTLSCADGSEVTLHDGKDGTDGTDGQNGKDGKNGADGKAGEKGTDGKNGADGTNGTNGTDGTSCTVADTTDEISNRAGYKLVCGAEFKGVVWDGIDGLDGRDGIDGIDGERGADGEKGDDGANGTSCTVADATDEATGRTGYKLVCGEEDKGTVWNGINGIDGERGNRGEKGETGAAGTSCTVADTTDEINNRTGYKLVCGGENKGTVWNGVDGNDGTSCTLEDLSNGAGSKIVCGGDSVGVVLNANGGMCGSNVYSLTTQICDTRDNQPYRIVTIGTQTWFAENLNYASNNSYCYNNSADNCAKYGRFYTWGAAKSACPAGWHLPSIDEWMTLINVVKETYSASGIALKSTTGWYNNGNGTDSYGFGVLPAGYRGISGDFYDAGKTAYFWVPDVSAGQPYSWYFAYDQEHFSYNIYKSGTGRSVRCLKNED